MPRHFSTPTLTILLACGAQRPQAPSPAVPPGPAVSVSSLEAVFTLPLPRPDTDSVTSILMVISWNQGSPPRMRMGDFGLWVGDTLADSVRLPVAARLQHLTQDYYWLDSTGSITAIASGREQALQVRRQAAALQLILGPSPALNQLRAWRPDSLRLDRSRADLTGPATLWVRPVYSP
jgi:hypothetical protein